VELVGIFYLNAKFAGFQSGYPVLLELFYSKDHIYFLLLPIHHPFATPVQDFFCWATAARDPFRHALAASIPATTVLSNPAPA
jgi:hypothetical protein